MYELMIKRGNELYMPVVIGSVIWEVDWSISPGRLTFKVLNSEDLVLEEGNAVSFKAGGVNVFYGFIFRLTYDAETVSVTAYDQIRYLKNKDSLVYKGLTADGVIRKIASLFNLQTGSLAPTGYNIGPRIEDNQTLADMIKNALDITLRNASKLFIFYDDFGKLTLRDIEAMKLDLLLDAKVAEDFTLDSSIDQNTYNKIKLVRDNPKTNKRDVFIAQDGTSMNRWGVLQHYEVLGEKENGAAKADALLKLYNKKSRGYSAKGVLGDISVRPGTSLVVKMTLGQLSISNYMVVEKVRHTFAEKEHTMDLELRGGSA